MEKNKLESRFPYYRVPLPNYGSRGGIKPDSRRKIIVCAGCSHTFGLTNVGESYPAILQSLLPENKFQVLNFGRPNYGLKLVLDWYEEFSRSVQPSIVVLQVPLLWRQPLSHQTNIPLNYTMTNGAWSIVRTGTIKVRDFIRETVQMANKDIDRIATFVENEQRKNVRVVILLYLAGKSLEMMSARYIHQLYFESIKQQCANTGASLVWNKFLTASEFLNEDMLMDFSHPNQKGNIYIAKLVQGAILSRAPEYRSHKHPNNFIKYINIDGLPKSISLAWRILVDETRMKYELSDNHEIYTLW